MEFLIDFTSGVMDGLMLHYVSEIFKLFLICDSDNNGNKTLVL